MDYVGAVKALARWVSNHYLPEHGHHEILNLISSEVFGVHSYKQLRQILIEPVPEIYRLRAMTESVRSLSSSVDHESIGQVLASAVSNKDGGSSDVDSNCEHNGVGWADDETARKYLPELDVLIGHAYDLQSWRSAMKRDGRCWNFPVYTPNRIELFLRGRVSCRLLHTGLRLKGEGVHITALHPHFSLDEHDKTLNDEEPTYTPEYLAGLIRRVCDEIWRVFDDMPVLFDPVSLYGLSRSRYLEVSKCILADTTFVPVYFDDPDECSFISHIGQLEPLLAGVEPVWRERERAAFQDRIERIESTKAQ